MATAVTAHSLSVLTNNSVKPPVNPKTGCATLVHERSPQFSVRLSDEYYCVQADEDERNETNEQGGGMDKDIFAVNVDDITKQLSNLSDDEFYHKLTELKEKHMKTLEICEQLYREKHGRAPITSRSFMESGRFASTMNGHKESGGIIRPMSATGSFERSQSPVNIVQDKMGNPTFASEILGRTSKPLTGKPPIPQAMKSAGLPSMRIRPSSAPIHRSQDDHLTLDEDLLQTVIGARRSWEESDHEDNIPDETSMSEPIRSQELSAALSRIEDMWEQFSIEDYAPRERRASSASMVHRKREKDKKIEMEWKHRITVPQPFKMTLRDAAKEKKKTRTQLQFEKEMLEKKMAEEEECQKKFKAAPVPAHVYLPLHQEIMEKQEERRRYVKQYCTELLKSQEKPFNFLKRDQDRKKHEALHECSDNVTIKDKTEKQTFKANPVPKHIFDKSIDDKMLEEEEYRQIRVKMRAEELLRSASLPPNMAARQNAIEQKLKEKAMKGKKKSRHRPKINGEVPDYDALYRQFQKELMRRKHEKEATVTEPFNLYTNRIPSKKDKVILDMMKDEEKLTENRWPFKTPRAKPTNIGHMSLSLDSIPSKLTKSAALRSSQVKEKRNELTKQEREEMEEERRRRIKQMKMRRYIQERTLDSTPRHTETPEEKKRKIREAERARIEEYEKELREMKERISKRPLLFEQESQTNAKKAAEKKFNATLRSVGLDEEFIRHGSKTGSVKDDDDRYEDDFEDTYIKTQADSPRERTMSP
ncbi:hypothetical protein CHS0354_021669 [Potamilus streckersoni]|uniref:Protein FAM161A n=1 Tax=Potamilus streckersoni TaxID=2493646 RepID=A0AAE0VYP4_9BIVA|nr:hypothetical protein CHS0354_021669 [Potamilus streckersoni]